MEPQELRELIAESVRAALKQDGEVLSREQLRELMHDACVDAMSTLGIDARNPLDFQRDMQFIRDLRLSSDRIRKHAITTLVGLLLAALLGAIGLGIKSLLHQP